MIMKKFKFLEHTADIKFQAFGKSLEEVFENSALALKEVIIEKKIVKEKTTKEIQVKGNDKEALLYRFLEEFLFLIEAENFIISKIKKIKIKDNKLTAEILGDKANNYKLNRHVKAITYNSMYVKQEKNFFIAQVVLDV